MGVGTLQLRNLVHHHSIFGAAFYTGCCPNIELGMETAGTVHVVSPPTVPKRITRKQPSYDGVFQTLAKTFLLARY